MAQLWSEEKNSPSILTIKAGPHKAVADQDWQAVTMELTSGKRVLHTLENEDSMLCRQPTDEVADLVANLRRFLAGEQTEVRFEPSEPSFELSFSRTRRGGIKVEAWLDAGNGVTGISTWDSAGVRFLTSDEHLNKFTQALAQEFSV